MQLKKLNQDYSICKVLDYSQVNLNCEYMFTGKTDSENSLLCQTCLVPTNTIERSDGWQGFCIQGVLDFSLVGILAKISNILSNNSISIFAVSTFNTDYIFVKKENYQTALDILSQNGYEIVD